jgi:hypothetical protein
MPQSIDELRASVAAQRERIPVIYGNVDFTITPERFCDDVAVRSCLETRGGSDRAKVLADQPLLERMRAYTMLGDRVADGYAALAPKFGFRRLIQMLVNACDKGLAGVPEAPPELAAFIADVEQVPDWIDRVCRILEPSFAKLFCTRNFLSKDLARAQQSGVAPTPSDYVLAGMAAGLMAAQMLTYALALKLPGLAQRADRSLVAKINRLLTRYGHADFTTDADA